MRAISRGVEAAYFPDRTDPRVQQRSKRLEPYCIWCDDSKAGYRDTSARPLSGYIHSGEILRDVNHQCSVRELVACYRSPLVTARRRIETLLPPNPKVFEMAFVIASGLGESGM